MDPILLDRFRYKLLSVLIQLYDHFGEKTVFYLEALSLRKTMLVRRLYQFQAIAGAEDAKSEASAQKLSIIEMIEKISEAVSDKKQIKKILCDRISGELRGGSDRRDPTRRRRVVDVNSTMLKCQNSSDNLVFFGQLVVYISRWKQATRRPSQSDSKLDTFFEDSWTRVQRQCESSPFIDRRVLKLQEKLPKWSTSLVKKTVEKLYRPKLKETTLKNFSKSLLSSLPETDWSRQLFDGDVGYSSLGAMGKWVHVHPRETRTGPTTRQLLAGRASQMSVIRLIEHFSLLVREEKDLATVEADKIDQILRVLLELRSQISELVTLKTKHNSRGFKKLSKDNEKVEQVCALFEKLRTDDNNSFCVLVRRLVLKHLHKKYDILYNEDPFSKQLLTKTLSPDDMRETRRVTWDLGALRKGFLTRSISRVQAGLNAEDDSGEQTREHLSNSSNEKVLKSILKKIAEVQNAGLDAKHNLNANVQSLAWQSVLVLLTLDGADSYPLKQMVREFCAEGARKAPEKQESGPGEWVRYMNFDFTLFECLSLSKDDKKPFRFWRCKKCKSMYSELREVKMPECKFKCKVQTKSKPVEQAKYAKRVNKLRQRNLILNEFWDFSFKGSANEKLLLSFRVVYLFKMCALLGLCLLYPESFEGVFELKKRLKERNRLNKMTDIDYLIGQVENELDYLKRVFLLNSKPFDTVRGLFFDVGHILSELGDIWRPTEAPEDSALQTDAYGEPNQRLFELLRVKTKKFKAKADEHIGERFRKVFNPDTPKRRPRITLRHMDEAEANGQVVKVEKEFANLFVQSMEIWDELSVLKLKEGLLVNRLADSFKSYFLGFYLEHRSLFEGLLSQLFFDNLEFGIEMGKQFEAKFSIEELKSKGLVESLKQNFIGLDPESVKDVQDKESKGFSLSPNELVVLRYQNFRDSWGLLYQERYAKGFSQIVKRLSEFKYESKILSMQLPSDVRDSTRSGNEQETKAHKRKQGKGKKTKGDTKEKKTKKRRKKSEHTESESSESETSPDASPQTSERSIGRVSVMSRDRDHPPKLGDFETTTHFVSLEKIHQINQNETWRLGNVMLNSKLKDTSFVMKLCESIPDFQNQLIDRFTRLSKPRLDTAASDQLPRSPHRSKRRTVNIYSVAKSDILNCQSSLLQEAFQFAGGYHFQSEHQLIEDMNMFLLRRALQPLPRLDTRRNKYLEYQSKESIILTEAKLEELQAKMGRQDLSQREAAQIREALEKRPDQISRVYQALTNMLWYLLQSPRRAEEKEQTIGKFAEKMSKFIEEDVDMRFARKKELQKIFGIYEVVEASVYPYLESNLHRFASRPRDSDLLGQLKTLKKDVLDVLLCGLKRFVCRIHLIESIEKKKLGEFVRDFKGVFRHPEKSVVSAIVDKYKKMVEKKGRAARGASRVTTRKRGQRRRREHRPAIQRERE